jgi:hypothetical protein
LRAALAVETACNRELITAFQKLRDILRDLIGTLAPMELEFAA